MNKEWCNEKLEMLSLRLSGFKPNPAEFFFEPTEAVYKKLESGDEDDLQYVVAEMARHLHISPIPPVKYDWGLKMEPEVAGQIKAASPIRSIRIPLFYAGRKYALGCILAHEMTHVFLFSRGIWLDNTDENEMVTDLAGVFVGLSKLLLNGLTFMANEDSSERIVLGYLSPELIVYCYERVNALRKVLSPVASENLVPEAQSKLRSHSI